jgi:hypothetical protein
MSIRSLLPICAMAAAMLVPAAALAQPFQINVNGAKRVIPYSTSGDNCDVLPYGGTPTAVTCPDGSRGTITVYGQSPDSPACEVDFWYEAGRWHAILSHENSANGTCAMNWNGATTLNISLH